VKNLLTVVLIAAMAVAAPLFLLGCDSGGGGGGGQNGQTTVINGVVSNVIAMNRTRSESIKFAEIMKRLKIVQDAKAQGGIPVFATVNGVLLDTTITDPDGSFRLSFPLESAENITLDFDINGTIVSISITVEAGTVLNIVVTINLNAPPGEEVEIVETEGPIRCQTGTVEIIKNPGQDIVIDGGGEDCIRTEGNCNLIVDPENIILTNCERCIDARGTSQVTLLTTDGNIFCDASGDGIRSVGNASVSLDASADIDITSVENGAKAEGNSVITFTAGACIFNSGEDAFDESGNATIDTSQCGEVIVGPGPSPAPSPSPGPSPSPSPSPAPSPSPSPAPSPGPSPSPAPSPSPGPSPSPSPT